MNTARRPLGTGPTASTRTTTPGPRLLPAERAEHDELLGDVDEHLVVPDRKGRRTLGPGTGTTGAVSPGATGARHDDAVARRGMPT
ncbi:hypothetical protein ACFXPY_45070 [Streptomyces sp. NPDC059153]|uniref:hypothetical protein n=1 Tax=Streptomyces sp. NPDC059153 TaxID=3346743 RepID=UPI0036B6EAF4